MISKLLDGLSTRRARRRGQRPDGGGGAAPATPAVAVSYGPRDDGRPDPGEVVWTWVPYVDDPTQGKDRPVVVIGRLGADLAAIALTTKDHGPARDRIAVGTGDWDRERRPSYAKIDRILTVEVGLVRREGSAFDPQRFEVLVEAVRKRNPELTVAGATTR